MSLSELRDESAGRLQFFSPASSAEIASVTSQFGGFKLSTYVAVLAQSNGVGELFCEGEQRFVHNMLLFSVEDALQWSVEFDREFLVVGSPGVDGVLYGLKKDSEAVFAHMPYEDRYDFTADSALDLLWRWHRNELAPL